jgi:hypothetical protein
MSLVLFPEKHHADVLALKNAKDVPGLIRYLNHRNSEIQWQAADALGTLGSDAVVPLIYVLDNGYKSVRIGAIESLGAIRDPRSVRPLAHLLKHDPAIEVRWIAALALGEIGDSTAIPPLVESLRDKERYVRYGAARSLELLHWIPRDDTEKAYYAIALQNWPVVKNIGKSATGPLADIFRDPDPATRVKIVELLGQIGDPDAQPACEAALRDIDPTVRWTAVVAAKKCEVRSAHIPWGIAKRQRTGQNPWAAAILNFFFVGLGYNYLGFWWGFLVFMSYMSIFTLAQLESGPFTPYMYAYPITALFAAQTFYMAKKRSDL